MIAFALQVVAAFNLVCTGTYSTQSLYQRTLPTSAERPFTIIYRVDLDRARYCADDCASTEPLAEARDAVLVLKNTSFLSGFESGTVITVDRETGQYRSWEMAGANRILHRGRCEQAPFTGFQPSASH